MRRCGGIHIHPHISHIHPPSSHPLPHISSIPHPHILHPHILCLHILTHSTLTFHSSPLPPDTANLGDAFSEGAGGGKVLHAGATAEEGRAEGGTRCHGPGTAEVRGREEERKGRERGEERKGREQRRGQDITTRTSFLRGGAPKREKVKSLKKE